MPRMDYVAREETCNNALSFDDHNSEPELFETLTIVVYIFRYRQ
jgi:hypothetical protein